MPPSDRKLSEIKIDPLSEIDIERKNSDRSYQEKIFQLKKQNLQFSHEYMYESCCFRVDKRVLDYFVKMFVIFSVVIFSMVKLFTGTKSNSEASVYTTMLWSMVTLLIPSPQISAQVQNSRE